jgi:hypothetical protein
VGVTTVEEINPPVACAEANCDRWVTPGSPGSQAEIVGWAPDAAAKKAVRAKTRRLHNVEDWHATGRHRCSTCVRNLAATGHATQGRLL